MSVANSSYGPKPLSGMVKKSVESSNPSQDKFSTVLAGNGYGGASLTAADF